MKFLSLSGKRLPVRNMRVLKTQFQYDLKKKEQMINIADKYMQKRIYFMIKCY